MQVLGRSHGVGPADHDTIDELIPRPPSAPRRLLLGLTVVSLSAVVGWAWGFGWLIPQPDSPNAAISGWAGLRVVDDISSDRVIIASVPVPNLSRFDLIVTDVRIEGIPVTIDEVLWSPEGNPSGPVRSFFVSASQPLPAEATPESQRLTALAGSGADGETVTEAMEDVGTEVVIDVYVRPDCEADWPTSPSGVAELSLRYEFPGRPSWWHRWVAFQDPLFVAEDAESTNQRGLLGSSAIDANDMFIEMSSLRSAMCEFAGAN